MGPNNTKNSSFKCDFLIFNYEQYCQNLVFIVKNPPNLIKKLFLCFVSKPKVGPINSQCNNFKWGNIFATICTLVLSLCIGPCKGERPPLPILANAGLELLCWLHQWRRKMFLWHWRLLDGTKRVLRLSAEWHSALWHFTLMAKAWCDMLSVFTVSVLILKS